MTANANTEPLPPRKVKGSGGGLSAVLALAGGYVAPPPNMVQSGAPMPPAPVPPPSVPTPAQAAASKIEALLEERRGGRRPRSEQDEWSAPPAPTKEGGMEGLKDKMREKQEGYRREEDSLRNRWQHRDKEAPPPPPEPAQVFEPLAENRSSLSMSWGQSRGLGGRGSSERSSQERGGIKVAPIVGKMPWVKGTVGPPSGAPSTGRRSKFGPPVEGAIPPPSIVTSQPTIGSGQEAPSMDWGPPPPGIRTDWSSMPAYQPPAWGAVLHGDGQPPDPKTGAYGYGTEDGVPPPPPEPIVEAPKKPSRNALLNPKPSAPIDMAAMLAAAQQHMQKALSTKLESIGVPIPQHLRKEAGLERKVETSEVYRGFELPEAIPLPGDPAGVDMDIADIMVPGEGIPPPPGLDDIAAPDDDIAAPDDDIAAPGDDIAAPGEDIAAPEMPRAPPPASTPPPGEEVLPPGEEDCRPPGED